MDLKPGTRLRSQVCTTEIIVVKPGSGDLALTCGGAPLVSINATIEPCASPATGLDTGTQLGKRYTIEGDDDLELLVTKAGAGTLAAGTTPLILKEARALPASD